MRQVLLVYCVFVAACAGGGPSSPTSTTAPRSALTATQLGTPSTNATGGSELPFSGTLESHQTESGDVRHLVGTGNATYLGRFTLTEDFTVDLVANTASGTGTWTAANGDQLFTTLTGHIVVTFPIGAITEPHTITGGTGRFAGASGTIVLQRDLNLLTFNSTGSMTGSISLGH